MHRTLTLLLGILACVLALAPAARAEVQVNARLSTGVVKLGSSVALLVEVEGAGSAQIQELAAVEGLRIGRPGAPSEQSFLSIVNGRRTSSRTLTWSIPISPEKKGEYKIPSVTVVADGKTHASNEVWLKVVEDLQGEQLGRFEISAPSTVVEGQPFTIELRFGWDVRMESQINRANLSLPWYGELGGVVELDPPPPEAGTSRISGVTINGSGNNEAEELAREKTDQGQFRNMRIRRRFLASRAGRLEFPISHLEFGQVSQDFLVQRESKLYYKRFPAFAIDVVALPEAGRPLDFSGAVGTLRASARADRTDVDVGDSIKLSVEWTGEGNLEFFMPPELDRLESFGSFRCFGKASERKTAERRVLTYDLAPQDDKVTEIPAIPLSVFDPKQNAYVTVSTQPVPIRVRPMKNATTLSEEGGPRERTYDIRDIQTVPEELHSRSSPGSALLCGALGLVAGGWLAGRTLVRRAGDPASPVLRARRRARRVLQRELASANDAQAQSRALNHFLAARSGESPEAWEGRDLAAWSTGRETRPEAVRALAALASELDHSIWAGRGVPLDRARILALADELVKGGL